MLCFRRFEIEDQAVQGLSRVKWPFVAGTKRQGMNRAL